MAFSGPKTTKSNIIRNKNDKGLYKYLVVYKAPAHGVHFKLRSQGWGHSSLPKHVSLPYGSAQRFHLTQDIYAGNFLSPLMVIMPSYHLSILAWNMGISFMIFSLCPTFPSWVCCRGRDVCVCIFRSFFLSYLSDPPGFGYKLLSHCLLPHWGPHLGGVRGGARGGRVALVAVGLQVWG